MSEPNLTRALIGRQIQMIAIGGCIGTGLFMGAGKAISLAGPAILLVFAVTGAMLYFVMRAMGELLLHDPSYKSFIDSTEDMLGPLAGFVVGWSYWFGWIVAGTGEIIAITGYIGFWWPNLQPWFVAALTVCIVTFINLFAVRAFGELEFWFAMIKVIAIIVLIAVGLWLAIIGFVSPTGVPARLSNLWSFGGLFPHGVDGLLRALQMTIFSFAGMEIIGTMMAEADDPEKNIPHAIRKIPLRVLIFYMGTVFTLMVVTPWPDISPNESPFVGMFSLVGLIGAASIINFVVISSAGSSCNSGIYATSRMLYGLAKCGKAPLVFGEVSKSQIPAAAVYVALLLMIGSSVLVLSFETMMNAFQIIGSVAAILFICNWAFILVSHLVYQRRFPEAHAHSKFRMPGSRWIPYVVLVFFAIALYALSLNEETRMALLFLPLWFVTLVVFYKLRCSPHLG